jgi:nitrogen fixation protein NifU and related proteins
MNLEELYQEIILDHSKRPRNFGPMEDATVTVKGDNPSCGDEVELSLQVTPERVENVRFTGHGCAICMASASLMTIKIKQRSREGVTRLLTGFHDMLIAPEPGPPLSELGDLQVFGAVRRFPQRVKCAMLSWRALEQALAQSDVAQEVPPVSTETEDLTD